MNERIDRAADEAVRHLRNEGVLVQLLVVRRTIAELQQMGFIMDELLRELAPARPITHTPRVVIAAPATEAHRPEAAVPQLRLVAGGGRQPVDDWADAPQSGWKAGA